MWAAIIKPVLKKVLLDEIWHRLGLSRSSSQSQFGSGAAGYGTGGKVALFPDDPQDRASVLFALSRAVSGDVFNLLDADPRQLASLEQLRAYVRARAQVHLQHWHALFGRQGVLGELQARDVLVPGQNSLADVLSNPIIDFAPTETLVAQQIDPDGAGTVDLADFFEQKEILSESGTTTQAETSDDVLTSEDDDEVLH